MDWLLKESNGCTIGVINYKSIKSLFINHINKHPNTQNSNRIKYLVNDKYDDLIVCGNINGNLKVFNRVIGETGIIHSNKSKYFFLGNYIDKNFGNKSLEILICIIIMKNRHKNKFYFLRGESEFSVIRNNGIVIYYELKKRGFNEHMTKSLGGLILHSLKKLQLYIVLNERFIFVSNYYEIYHYLCTISKSGVEYILKPKIIDIKTKDIKTKVEWLLKHNELLFIFKGFESLSHKTPKKNYIVHSEYKNRVISLYSTTTRYGYMANVRFNKKRIVDIIPLYCKENKIARILEGYKKLEWLVYYNYNYKCIPKEFYKKKQKNTNEKRRKNIKNPPYENPKIGDLILFEGRSDKSDYLVRKFSGSKITHVAVGDIINCVVYSHESTVQYETKHIDYHTQKIKPGGPMLLNLNDRLNVYKGRVYVRRINKDYEDKDKMFEFYKKNSHKVFETSNMEMFNSHLKIGLSNQSSTEEFFCSEYIAELFQEIGFLDNKIASRFYEPKQFINLKINSDVYVYNNKLELIKPKTN